MAYFYYLYIFSTSRCSRNQESLVPANSSHYYGAAGLDSTCNDQSSVFEDNVALNSSTEGDDYYSYSESESSEDCEGPLNSQVNIEKRIAKIKKETNCTHETVRGIAQLVIDLGHPCHRDPRTILKTNVVLDMSDTFIHIGLSSGILKKPFQI